MTQVIDFIHDTRAPSLPVEVIGHARRALLDLMGVAAAGSHTKLSSIICTHAVTHYGASHGCASNKDASKTDSSKNGAAQSGSRILFDGRRASPPGAALAGGTQIDSVDAHDGHKLTKGHVGCGVLPACLAMSETLDTMTEAELLEALIVGYEVGVRAGIALHQSVPDYHTSGAWVAVAAAAIGARLLNLDTQQTRHALGVAEYHGPRSQMMRCIDHPTMVKDGSGWGSMAGLSAAFLAQEGYTGAPAITVEHDDQQSLWSDLGTRWYMSEQYIKLYPVCRWAQPAMIAAIALKQKHSIDINQIKTISIATFHESTRLAVANPATTEQAQYSLPFPVAAALVHGDVGVKEIDGPGLVDQRVLDLSRRIKMTEVEQYNQAFPRYRYSSVSIELEDGQVFESDRTEAAGDPENPLSDDELSIKFERMASPVLGPMRTGFLKDVLIVFGNAPDLSALNALIYSPGETRAEHSNPASSLEFSV